VTFRGLGPRVGSSIHATSATSSWRTSPVRPHNLLVTILAAGVLASTPGQKNNSRHGMKSWNAGVVAKNRGRKKIVGKLVPKFLFLLFRYPSCAVM
ncbi:GPI-anchored surface protein, putative, partial [Bodo saltans]